MKGQGKYGHLLDGIAKETGANNIILFVLDGDQGAGFCVQVEPHRAEAIPGILRISADMMEKDVQEQIQSN